MRWRGIVFLMKLVPLSEDLFLVSVSIYVSLSPSVSISFYLSVYLSFFLPIYLSPFPSLSFSLLSSLFPSSPLPRPTYIWGYSNGCLQDKEASPFRILASTFILDSRCLGCESSVCSLCHVTWSVIAHDSSTDWDWTRKGKKPREHHGLLQDTQLGFGPGLSDWLSVCANLFLASLSEKVMKYKAAPHCRNVWVNRGQRVLILGGKWRKVWKYCGQSCETWLVGNLGSLCWCKEAVGIRTSCFSPTFDRCRGKTFVTG